MTARSRGKRPARTRASVRAHSLDRNEIEDLIQHFSNDYEELVELKAAALAAPSSSVLDNVLGTFLSRLVSRFIASTVSRLLIFNDISVVFSNC
jgi:hypothetical protein